MDFPEFSKILGASGLAALAPRLRRVLASLARRRASPPRPALNRGRRISPACIAEKKFTKTFAKINLPVHAYQKNRLKLRKNLPKHSPK